MFARPFASLLIVAALAVPAFAQEQRGAIEGIVRDASGAVLPGFPAIDPKRAEYWEVYWGIYVKRWEAADDVGIGATP